MPSPLGFIILHCLVFVLFPVTFSGICLLFSQVVWSCPAKGFNLFDQQKYSSRKASIVQPDWISHIFVQRMNLVLHYNLAKSPSATSLQSKNISLCYI
jgi:hypothetical protein